MVKLRSSVLWTLLGLTLFLTMAAVASDKHKDASATTTAPAANAQDDTARLAGELRFRANCSRCHAAPPKFPPRAMATIVRHMRVRAILTDDDARLILHYMTR